MSNYQLIVAENQSSKRLREFLKDKRIKLHRTWKVGTVIWFDSKESLDLAFKLADKYNLIDPKIMYEEEEVNP